MKGDLIERDDVLKAIWDWCCNREYTYTNATYWLQKRIEAIPSAKDKADRKTEPQTDMILCPIMSDDDSHLAEIFKEQAEMSETQTDCAWK